MKIKLVDSQRNPTDIVSRGMTASNLVASVWISGPDFLHQSENNWPNLQVGDNFTPSETVCVNNLVPNDTHLSDVIEDKVCDNDLVSDGTRLSDVVGDNVKNHSACGGASMLAPTTYSVNNETCLSNLIDINKFSSLQKPLRVTAFIIHFVKDIKRKIHKKCMREEQEIIKINSTIRQSAEEFCGLLAEEIEFRKMLWIREEQKIMRKHFQQINSSLRLFEDGNQVLRV